ncbi:MAG: NAD(P)H-dependent oxidoreductase [Planctomycetes bacterium]|nr:NAD(P)H-dependent oxidoreductase [Planctomycetota bacterium]
MKILLILAHPDPKSFNRALADAACEAADHNGHEVIFHDLYAEKFDPILYSEEAATDGPVPEIIHKHCEELCTADGIIIVHPNWWGQPPAILKGWTDRVIRPEVAYRFEDGDSGEGVPIGLLQARVALVLNTSNTSEEREELIFGDPLERIWKDCIFDLCGVKHFHRRMFRTIVTSTQKEREDWLEEAKILVDQLFSKVDKHHG